jgi:hypothetical protein
MPGRCHDHCTSLAGCLVHVCTKFHALEATGSVRVLMLALGWAALETVENHQLVYVRL